VLIGARISFVRMKITFAEDTGGVKSLFSFRQLQTVVCRDKYSSNNTGVCVCKEGIIIQVEFGNAIHEPIPRETYLKNIIYDFVYPISGSVR